MTQIEKLFNSLREIYGQKVYNIDNQFLDLKRMGWFNNLKTKRPDFLIIDFEDRDILIDVKTINEQENDIKIKKNFLETLNTGKGSIGFYVPEMKEKVKQIIRDSNKQFKDFINSEDENLKENISTIIVIYCNRISLNYTISDIEDFIHGQIREEIKLSEELVPHAKFEVKDKLLNMSSLLQHP